MAELREQRERLAAEALQRAEDDKRVREITAPLDAIRRR
jgi:hypothetical protein